MRTAKNKNEKGYTLLEYCAGAAIVLGILYGTLQAVQGSLTMFLNKVGKWAENYTIAGQTQTK